MFKSYGKRGKRVLITQKKKTKEEKRETREKL